MEMLSVFLYDGIRIEGIIRGIHHTLLHSAEPRIALRKHMKLLCVHVTHFLLLCGDVELF